jgi:hypothetical protein
MERLFITFCSKKPMDKGLCIFGCTPARWRARTVRIEGFGTPSTRTVGSGTALALAAGAKYARALDS